MRRITIAHRIVLRDDTARLHRIGHNPMIVDGQMNDMRCLRGRLHQALGNCPSKAQIARYFGGNQRRACRACCSRIDHRRQRRVIDCDALGGVERLLAALRDDQRHRLADIAYLAGGEQRLRREAERLAGLRIRINIREQRLELVGLSFRRGQHCQHAGHRPRRLQLDALDARVRVRRAQHHRMRQTVEDEIVEIAAPSGQKPLVLAALWRGADAGMGHCHRSRLSVIARR